MLQSIALTLLLFGPTALAEDPSAAELLAAMDDNLQSESQESTVAMTVSDGRRDRVYRMHVVSRGRASSAMEYLAPDREKGTRMLKVDDQMWLYLPRAERVQKISGHMMRQGMMGSDMSYEDMMVTEDFDEMYSAVVIGSEDIDGRKHWKLEATANDSTIAYPRRVIWIDDAHRIPTRQDLYALSGMLLKTWTMSDIQVIDGRNVPMRMTIVDALREGSSTTIVTEALTFDVALEDEVFSRRWLERGQ
jgi:outer membrane lipoprotein-sorting protein